MSRSLEVLRFFFFFGFFLFVFCLLRDSLTSSSPSACSCSALPLLFLLLFLLVFSRMVLPFRTVFFRTFLFVDCALSSDWVSSCELLFLSFLLDSALSSDRVLFLSLLLIDPLFSLWTSSVAAPFATVSVLVGAPDCCSSSAWSSVLFSSTPAWSMSRLTLEDLLLVKDFRDKALSHFRAIVVPSQLLTIGVGSYWFMRIGKRGMIWSWYDSFGNIRSILLWSAFIFWGDDRTEFLCFNRKLPIVGLP